MKAQIIDATGRAAYAAPATESLRNALTIDERDRLTRGAAQWERSAAAFITAIGADGWTALGAPLCAMPLNAVMRRPDAAIRATLVVHETLTADERLQMRRALLAPCPVRHVVQALQHGAPWRRRMHEFLPDDHATNKEGFVARVATAIRRATVRAHGGGRRCARRIDRSQLDHQSPAMMSQPGAIFAVAFASPHALGRSVRVRRASAKRQR